MKKASVITRFVVWRLKNLGDRQFILILSALIGLGVGLVAVVIKNLVHFIQLLLTGTMSSVHHNLYFFALPFAGILLTILFVRYINRQPVGHGIPSVLYSISKNNGIIPRHNLFSSVVSSALTVGFGGSVGLEGPTVATGAAVGSNVGRALRMDQRQVILLLGCACAGAMSSIFKAPIAAIVFALEVIMLDLTMSSLVPLLIASLTAALTSYLFLGQNVLYTFENTAPFMMEDIPYYLILGVLAGLVSVYFTKMYMKITEAFEKIKGVYKRLLLGGLILGILIFLLPSLYGEGYEPINKCLNGDYSYLFDNTLYESLSNNIFAVVFFFLMVVLLKVVATSLTFASGGVGGIFAPSLFIGSNLGLLFATVLNTLGVEISRSNFALVGMGGLIAGVIHAPLTAIFLIAEITAGYQLFMPLMIVATVSYTTTRLFVSNSVYTIQLAKRGELMTHHKDRTVLLMMRVEDLIETDFNIIHPNATLGDLVRVITRAHRNIFPVVDGEGNFHGIVKLDDIRDLMFDHEQYDSIFVRDLMFMPRFTISKHESMEEVARKFQVSGRFNIAVLDDGKYLGFVSRAKLFSVYREKLKYLSEE